jgi:hypothetical protein
MGLVSDRQIGLSFYERSELTKRSTYSDRITGLNQAETAGVHAKRHQLSVLHYLYCLYFSDDL